MYQTVIIADDYSSAADCGVQFAKYGISAAAILNKETMYFPDKKVIALDSDSRALNGEEACARVRYCVKELKKRGYRRIFKSVDSTLRGNPGSEIKGILKELDLEYALIAPAFPFYGRVISNGIHYLNGIRLEDSFMRNDPVCPMRESSLIKILESQTGSQVVGINIENVRAGKDVFLEKIQEYRKKGIRFIAVDGVLESDVSRVAEYAYELEHCLIAGSTGLARYLPVAWKLGNTLAENIYKKSERRIVIAAGSRSPVTKKQIEILKRETQCSMLEIPPEVLIDRTFSRFLSQASFEIKKNRKLILYVSGEKMNLCRKNMDTMFSLKIAEGLGKFVESLATNEKIDGLVLTGGDTAREVCDSLQGKYINLLGEIEPGIPMGILEGDISIGMVIKAGAFGSDYALVNAVKKLGG